MDSKASSLLLIAVVIMIGIFALRSCKQVSIHQSSNDDKASLSVDVKKRHHHHNDDN